MIRIFAVGFLVIVHLFSHPVFALEKDKAIGHNIKKEKSVAKVDKEDLDDKTKDLNGLLKPTKTERAEDHDHYGKFLLFKVLSGGGSRR